MKERRVLDAEQVKQLFDPSRDPTEGIRDDDWHPSSYWQDLDWEDTIATRRSWFVNLWKEGEL